MRIKRLMKTKTFWGAISGIAAGVMLILSGNKPEGIVAIIAAVQSLFLRDSNLKIEDAAPKVDKP